MNEDEAFACVYCGKDHQSASGTGVDVECCGEVGHVETQTEAALRWAVETGAQA